ncbi:MAG: TRAP transporter substrate-binding protein DctP, partial [Desulfosarcina sp.]
MTLLKTIRPVLAVVLLTVLLNAMPAAAGTTVIKIAVVMPEGSTWTNTLQEFARAVDKETAGEVAFKIYAGGISGDEVDVLRKMRVGRLHAGG